MGRQPGDTWSSVEEAALERDLGFVGSEVSSSRRRGWAARGVGSVRRKQCLEEPQYLRGTWKVGDLSMEKEPEK